MKTFANFTFQHYFYHLIKILASWYVFVNLEEWWNTGVRRVFVPVMLETISVKMFNLYDIPVFHYFSQLQISASSWSFPVWGHRTKLFLCLFFKYVNLFLFIKNLNYFYLFATFWPSKINAIVKAWRTHGKITLPKIQFMPSFCKSCPYVVNTLANRNVDMVHGSFLPLKSQVCLNIYLCQTLKASKHDKTKTEFNRH